MNNDDLKRLLKQEINFDIKDCLDDIKCCDVDVLPSSIKNHFQYGKAFKYGLYGLLGVSILGSSSVTAYNYITPTTYVTIEVGDLKQDLAARIDPNFMFKVDLNSFNKVIAVDCNVEYIDALDVEHMDYKDAIPMVIDYLKDLTDSNKKITLTVISDDKDKSEAIDSFFDKFIKDIDDINIFINSSIEDQKSQLSIGKQRAIDLILRKTSEYDRSALERKSLSTLLKILFEL